MFQCRNSLVNELFAGERRNDDVLARREELSNSSMPHTVHITSRVSLMRSTRLLHYTSVEDLIALMVFSSKILHSKYCTTHFVQFFCQHVCGIKFVTSVSSFFYGLARAK